MDDLIFLNMSLSYCYTPISHSTAGGPSAPFVLHLVMEQLRRAEVDMRNTGYKIMNSGG